MYKEATVFRPGPGIDVFRYITDAPAPMTSVASSRENLFFCGKLARMAHENGVRSVGGGRAEARNAFVVVMCRVIEGRTASIAAAALFGRFPVS